MYNIKQFKSWNKKIPGTLQARPDNFKKLKLRSTTEQMPAFVIITITWQWRHKNPISWQWRHKNRFRILPEADTWRQICPQWIPASSSRDLFYKTPISAEKFSDKLSSSSFGQISAQKTTEIQLYEYPGQYVNLDFKAVLGYD
jgi:hypothetical protein